MSDSPTTKTARGHDLAKGVERAAILILGVSKELWLGIRHHLVPWNACMAATAACCLLFMSGADHALLERLHIGKLYPTSSSLQLYYFLWLYTSPLWTWAFFRWAVKQRRSRELERVFTEAGLRSVRGRVPKLVFEKDRDDHTTVLCVTVAGANLEKFRDAKKSIESNLGIYIDDIKENRKKGTIDIVYSSEEMPSLVKITEIGKLPPCKFLVGETRASIIRADIREVAHLLVAGQTGGGKSTFLRQFITTHYLNIVGATFILIDLKEGVEFRLFRNLPRVKIYESVKEAVGRLRDYDRNLQERLTAIKEAQCTDLDQYRKKLGKAASYNREFIVVDEAAELFLAGGGTKSQDVEDARRILSDVARRGRAAGVHLVIATQRPDTRSLDPQVKANLPGVLCFQMVNDASSVLVLGVGRATDLPAKKGRAIWKESGEMVELQTPFLTDTETLALLDPLKESAAELVPATKDEAEATMHEAEKT